MDTEPAGGGGAASVIAKPGPSTVPALGLALPYTPLVVAGGGGGGGAALPDDPGSYGGNGGNGGKPAVDGEGGEYYESAFPEVYGYGGTGAGSSSAAGTDGQVGDSGFADSGFTWAGGGGGGGGLPGGTGGADGYGGGGGGGGQSWASSAVTDSMGLADTTSENGIAVDPAGHAYVSNTGNNSVTAYIPDANGNIVPSIVIKGAKTGLDQPNGLSFDNSGALLVTNGTGTITR